jgi:hypothetical protein
MHSFFMLHLPPSFCAFHFLARVEVFFLLKIFKFQLMNSNFYIFCIEKLICILYSMSFLLNILLN